MKHVVDSPIAQRQPNERRSFMTSAAAIVIGGIVAVFPFAAGIGVLVDPLRRRARRHAVADENDAVRFVRVGPLDVLPADGQPHQFALTDDVIDAWTRASAQRVGTAFLTRTNTDGRVKITAFSSVCPHLGCAVDYDRSAGEFECPCHASAFAKDGKRLFGPSLRGLDPLEVKLVDSNGEQEIWVERARFQAGIAERILVG